MRLHRFATKRGIDLIKAFEGFSPIIYLCPANIRTIGYGHVVQKGETFTRITRDEADVLLKKDLYQAERSVMRLIRVFLTDNMFDALASWTFNLGSGALQRSTLRARLNRGEYDEVPGEIRKWVFAGGRRLQGLVRRREAEASLFAIV